MGLSLSSLTDQELSTEWHELGECHIKKSVRDGREPGRSSPPFSHEDKEQKSNTWVEYTDTTLSFIKCV